MKDLQEVEEFFQEKYKDNPEFREA